MLTTYPVESRNRVSINFTRNNGELLINVSMFCEDGQLQQVVDHFATTIHQQLQSYKAKDIKHLPIIYEGAKRHD